MIHGTYHLLPGSNNSSAPMVLGPYSGAGLCQRGWRRKLQRKHEMTEVFQGSSRRLIHLESRFRLAKQMRFVSGKQETNGWMFSLSHIMSQHLFISMSGWQFSLEMVNPRHCKVLLVYTSTEQTYHTTPVVKLGRCWNHICFVFTSKIREDSIHLIWRAHSNHIYIYINVLFIFLYECIYIHNMYILIYIYIYTIYTYHLMQPYDLN